MPQLEPDVRLDRVLLEEAGADPIALAEAIHQQLGPRKGPVPVLDIARALDIEEVREEPLHGLEAALITTPERGYGAIVVKSSSSMPRRRFSIGHELGHYLDPDHIPTTGARFECTRTDMGLVEAQADPARSRHQDQEIAANLFAIELLAPRSRMTSFLHHEPDLQQVLAIATEFVISRTAAARRYVAMHASSLAIAFSHDDCFNYVERGRAFPALALRRGDSMPAIPRATGNRTRSAFEEVDSRGWLRLPHVHRLWAQTLYQQNRYRMTLLSAETDP